MNNQLKVLMKYRYRGVWREKFVTLGSVADRTRDGKYRERVEAVRGGAYTLRNRVHALCTWAMLHPYTLKTEKHDI